MKLLGHGRRTATLLALSICGNLALGIVLILRHYEQESPKQTDRADDCARLGPEFIPWAYSALQWCEARPESRLAQLLPNTVYLAFDGTALARVEFVDEDMNVVREITMSDRHGRPWVDVNLQDETLIYSRYTGQWETDPQVSLRDEDGDGIPDVMVNWELKRSFKRSEELKWARIDSK